MWRLRPWMLLGVLSLAASGCATKPPTAALASTPPSSGLKASASGPTCSPCAEQTREVERLRRDVASRDAELFELRTNQRVQVKVLQRSNREITRAKVKLRRLATRAEAASYIAEVEVALASARSRLRPASTVPQIAQAERLLESTDAPFAQGDYGLAMDRAAEAEQLIASASENQVRRLSYARSKSKAAIRAKMPLKAPIATKQRGRPIGKAHGVG